MIAKDLINEIYCLRRISNKTVWAIAGKITQQYTDEEINDVLRGIKIYNIFQLYSILSKEKKRDVLKKILDSMI